MPLFTATSLRADPAFRLALSRSLLDSIVSDQRMWTLDASYRVGRESNSMCSPKGYPSRPWAPGGRCGYFEMDCQHSIYVLDVPCTLANTNELLWQFPRYVWAQAKLRELLSNRPEASYPTPARARQWARWCWDVCELISLAVWSTNIRDAYAGKLVPGSSGTRPDVWDSTPYLDLSDGPKLRAFRERLAGEKTEARYGAHARSEVRMPTRWRLWNRVVNGHGWKRESNRVFLQPPEIPRQRSDFSPVEAFWPNAWKDAIGRRPDSLGFEKPYYTESPPTDRFERLVRLFELSRSPRALLVPVEYLDVRNRPQQGTYLSLEGFVGYLEAAASDLVIDRPYARWVSHGLKVWNDAFMRLPGDYRRNLQGNLDFSRALATMATEAHADQYFLGAHTALSATGAVLASIPFGQIAAVGIAVVQALLTVLHEVFKALDIYAQGGGAIPPCPPPPVIRIIKGGQECNWDDPERDGMRRDELESEAQRLFPERSLPGSSIFTLPVPIHPPRGGAPRRNPRATNLVLGAAGAAALVYWMRQR
ncbi:hypothetical protein [Sandaracinus amylolyticus]|uniref:hypothetical protein n=1 Tax=Sandaracinus amylolyticus TaxID=927083 RepID=UPI00069F74F2|nr:hypothetical protein [Sandaracinus amylolyticus]